MRKHKLHIFTLPILFLFVMIFVSQTLWAKTVISMGEGRTVQSAINDGIMVAVKKAMGSYITSLTDVAKGKLIYDRITSESAGYVKSYRVVAEEKDLIRNIYRVKLSVVVDDIKLKNIVSQFMGDPKFQRTFQETKFDERKVVVLYQSKTDLDLPYDSKAVQSVMDLVQDRLVENGFRVFLPYQLKRIRNLATEAIIDKKTALDISKQEAGDAVVLVSLDAGKRFTDYGYYIIYATITLKAYDCTTGELFANVQIMGSTISRGGEYGLQNGITRIVTKIGPKATDRLIKKIVERFSGAREKFVLLILKNVNANEESKAENTLDRLGWTYRIDKQVSGYVEIEIFNEADPTSIRRILERSFKENAVNLVPTEMSGSRIVFEGRYRNYK